MSLGVVAFYLLGVLSLGAGVGAVSTRNVVYAALFLLLSLIGVAGLFILLVAEFLALVQVLIYGGAITVVILFAIMLTRVGEYQNMRDNPQRPLAFLIAVAVFGVLVAAILAGVPAADQPRSAGFATLGTELFTIWAIPFEVASLVLLVALIGAILVARAGGRE